MSSFLNALVNSDDASCGPVNPLSQLAKGLGGQQGEGSQIGRDRFAPIAGPSGSVAGPSGFRTHQLHPQELQQDAAARAFFEHQQHAASIRPQQHASPSPGPVPAWASDFMTHAQGPANAPPPPVMSERAWQKSRMPDTRTALDHHAQQSAPAWAADFSNLHRAQASSPASTVPMYAQQPQHHQQPLHVGFPAVSSSMHMSMPMLQHQQPMLYQHQHFQAQHLHQPARSEQTSGTPRIQELESTHWESAFLQHVEHPDAKSSLIDGQAERSQMQEYPPHESLTARPTSPSQRTHGQDADLLSKTAGELLQNVSRDLETNDKMRNSSFMRLMQKLRDKEVTVQGDQMVEGGEAQQQQIDPSLTHGGVHVGDVDVQRELQQEALRAQQPLLAGGGRGEAVCARPQGTAGNPMAGTAGATFASGNWQQRQGAQQPDTQSAQREAQEMDELAAAYEEMNSVLDDDVQSRAQRAFQGDGGRMDTSVPGASAAWEEDFDDFDFDNALLRSGPEPPTMAQSLRENAQQQEWGHLQSQWDSLVTDAAGIQLQQPTGATASSSSAALANYPFHSRNPYMLNAQHRHHLPSDTILAREAAVQESPSNPLAWLSLGLKQQENEREELAIRALQRALELDPTLGEAWLALAVSYTNDNVRGKAYDAIERWVESKGEYESVIEHHRERAGGASAREAGQVLNSQRHAYLTGLLVDMARAGGGESGVDADVQIALGVLFNASEEYEKASDCFMAALSVRPNDPHLFNRLGATMANSGKAESALDYYYRALELQPDFARATFNLAIACMNLGAYQEAGEHVLRALSIQQSSTADEDVGDASVLRQMSEEEHAASSNQLWDTLATCCNSLRKPELAEACKGRNLAPFRAEFVF